MQRHSKAETANHKIIEAQKLQEQQRKLNSLFDQIDHNKDGQLT